MIFLDFETRSAINVKDVGPWLYARHPSTDLICMAWAYGLNAPEVWDPKSPFPKKLLELITQGHTIEAHNAAFERAIWELIAIPRYDFPSVPFDRWSCTMARAAAMGLPQGLDQCAKALQLDLKKDAEGKKAMLKATSPIKAKKASLWDEEEIRFDESPELLQKVYAYCAQDVEVERQIAAKLRPLTKTESQVWLLDQKINLRGIQVDTELAKAGIELVEVFQTKNNERLGQITDGALTSANQVEAVKSFLKSRGVELSSLSAEAVESLLGQSDLDPIAKEVLEIRASGSKTSLAKFAAMLERVDTDGRMRDLLRYFGAFTGRWSGAGAQIQNIPRGSIGDVDRLAEMITSRDWDLVQLWFGDLVEAAVSALRPCLTSSPGKVLNIWDFAQIEARLLAAWARCEKLLELFRQRKDVYKAFAAEAFRKPLDRVSKDERFIGKTCVLGLGYGMGAAKLQASFESYGMPVSASLCKTLVETYRQAYPEIPAFWFALENGAKAVLDRPGKKRHGFQLEGRFLTYELPTARKIYYLDPEMRSGKLAYKKAIGANLAKVDTYGGKLAENVIQALAREVMAGGMLGLDKAGFSLVATVHDELLAEEDGDRIEEGKEILEQAPFWCTAPLVVEGFVSKRYRK